MHISTSLSIAYPKEEIRAWLSMARKLSFFTMHTTSSRLFMVAIIFTTL